MGTPGGGPKDEEPPRVLMVTPASGSTEVDPKSAIEIVFSEPINRETLLESLYITPSSGKKPNVRFRGNKVRIKPPDPIPENRTLVLSIGSDLTDLQRNKLEASITIALTAGVRIDQGSVSGRVFTQKDAQGMIAGAWLVNDSLEFDPSKYQPEFLTQAGAEGWFVLDYLPAGRYRLICWDDRDHDRLYDPAADRLGLPWRDLQLKEDSEAWMELFPVKRDTTELRLFVASASDNRHLVIRYNKALDRSIAEILPRLAIYDTTGILRIHSAWMDAVDSSRLVILTEDQVPEREYFIELSDDTTVFGFTGSAVPDTVGPRIVISYPTDGQRSIEEFPVGWIGFDDALKEESYIALLTRIAEDSTEEVVGYTITLQRREANILHWQSPGELPFGESFSLEIDMREVHDRFGNVSPDTTWTIIFSIIDPVETGSISGSFKDNIQNAVVFARSTETRRASETSVNVNDDGTFKLQRLKAGEYFIWAFSDIDRNGHYSVGSLKPFVFAERFTVNDDTVKVRNRWETAGVTVGFR